VGQIVTEKGLEVLTLMSWPGIGAARTRSLLRSLAPGQSVIEAASHLRPDRALGIAEAPTGLPYSVTETLGSCEALGISILCMLDDAYPSRLRAVNDAPPILYMLGTSAALKLPSVAVVGTRDASPAGKKSAHTIAGYLAGHGCSVVSGLALGIDTAAHEGALAGRGTTVAVLAHGLDTVAPTSNKPLAARITESGGALVSEHPPGTPPRPPEFARRNRIQSGLSVMSVIVESGAEGGAIIQAKFTHDQGRLLCVVVSEDPTHNRAGAERLMHEYGALPIRTRSDLERLLASISVGEGAAPEGCSGQLEFEW